MLKLVVIAAALLAPTAVYAHPELGTPAGFDQGFLHPLGGLDHVLAMTVVGLLAAQIGGRALWALPLSFVAMMIAGGALGMSNIPVPFVETGIALSIVVLGLAVAFGLRLLLAAAGLAGLFAIFHGHAHGTEMPATASALSYAVGFVAATCLLHGVGLAAGLLMKRTDAAFGIAARTAGGSAALAGAALLTGLL